MHAQLHALTHADMATEYISIVHALGNDWLLERLPGTHVCSHRCESRMYISKDRMRVRSQVRTMRGCVVVLGGESVCYMFMVDH
jgi:hypothetical protein